MSDLLLVSVDYGGYISVVKLVIFLVLFFSWLPLLGWVYTDARAVETKEDKWTGIVLAAGAVGAIIWLLVPVFIVGMLLYIIAVGAAFISYITHRNARVMDFDRVLTAEHIKGLLLRSEAKKLDALKSFLFISSKLASGFSFMRSIIF